MALNPWWGEVELPDRGYRSLRLGPMELLLSRASGVLQVAWRSRGDPLSEAQAWSVLDTWEAPPGFEVRRFAAGSGSIRLHPRLPDRFVVARPEQHMVVPAGSTLVAYLSSPLWLALSEGDTLLADLPVSRPSDTWFGPSTMEGHLGYALRTKLLTSLERLRVRSHRAISRITIENRSPMPLGITRLRLPMADLALFAGATAVWTEELKLVRGDDGDTDQVDIGAGAPAEAGSVTALASPRDGSRQSPIVRVFNALFSGLER